MIFLRKGKIMQSITSVSGRAIQQLTIKFIKTHPNAVMPKPAHQYGDAGFDIYAVEETVLPPGEVTVVRTGLQLADCPTNGINGAQYYLDIRSRSGLSRKLVFPVTGTVDVNYRGEIGVVLANFGKVPYVVNSGERVAQLVIQQIIANTPTMSVVFEETDSVADTDRGSGGFGSSGV
jgi:dUTP pyrophosphatase